MPLHLVKLCVGADSIKDLEDWVKERLKQAAAKGQARRHIHVTRMTPKREAEILDGGSLYWVIKGEIACREKIAALEPFRDKDGISRCRIVMEPKIIRVEPRPMRAFQGWRYFQAKDAPPDTTKNGQGSASLPEPLRKELRELGLL
jgi:hypothetical protein